jgi:hypothetical protein
MGNYRLVKATTNGKPNGSIMMDRTMSFNGDNTFIGNISMLSMQGKDMLYNKGLYFVENDSMLIMHQTTNLGALLKTAFVYNYKISGDTLKLKGYYTREPLEYPTIPVMLKYYIDESWVRIDKK